MKTKKTAMQKFKEMRYSQFINTNLNTLAVKVKEESKKLKETCFIMVNELITKMPHGYGVEYHYELIAINSEGYNVLPKEIKLKMNHNSEKMNFIFKSSLDKDISVVIR